jgi:hypothetical protein
MELLTTIDPKSLERASPIAESGEFALYSRGLDSYLFVQKHAGTPWSGLVVSGDGVFRIGGLFVDAMRHLYRDVASDVTAAKNQHRA